MKRIAIETSPETAIKLVKAFPGKRLYVPFEIDEAHEISQVIGLEQAQKLCDFFGGWYGELPTGVGVRNAIRDKTIIDDYYNNGASTIELGRKHSLSPRQIMRIVKGKNTDDNEESNE